MKTCFSCEIQLNLSNCWAYSQAQPSCSLHPLQQDAGENRKGKSEREISCDSLWKWRGLAGTNHLPLSGRCQASAQAMLLWRHFQLGSPLPLPTALTLHNCCLAQDKHWCVISTVWVTNVKTLYVLLCKKLTPSQPNSVQPHSAAFSLLRLEAGEFKR